MPKGTATKKAALPRALMPGMEPPDFLRRFDLVINRFMSDCCLRLNEAEPRKQPGKNGQSDRQTPKWRKCPVCLYLFPQFSERVPRTTSPEPRTPRPRRFAGKTKARFAGQFAAVSIYPQGCLVSTAVTSRRHSLQINPGMPFLRGFRGFLKGACASALVGRSWASLGRDADRRRRP